MSPSPIADRLNNMPLDAARRALADCCACEAWISAMLQARPFPSDAALLERADLFWNDLDPDDWLEAFSHHPRIGQRKPKAVQSRMSGVWSKGEQSGMSAASPQVRAEFERLNLDYEKQFGFVFLICATGKSAGEMLKSLKSRLNRDLDEEIEEAAEQQRLITRLRLRKLAQP